MKILVVGQGGREHAIAWKIAQSPSIETVFVAPGNAGTAQENKVANIAISALDISALIHFAKTNEITLTIVGPEAPLAAGIVDRFQAADLPCFGPSQKAAQLESSKAFSKHFMAKYAIPTADYQCFTELNEAIHYIKQQQKTLVIKADGLAAGKGVIIAKTETEAINAVTMMLAGNAFGDAGHRVVIEEFLEGEEVSFIVMVDGKHALPLATSQDHKARDDGDMGPNTGGMGAYSPAPVVDANVHQQIMEQVIFPTVAGMAAENTPYVGFLYAGIMLTKQGPQVLEFNCRLGDPETQPIMMRLQSNLVELCQATLNKELANTKIQWDPRPALGVVLAAGGYPAAYKKGLIIEGLEKSEPTDWKIFHAGTKQQDKEVITDGGRVLCVTALGDDFASAQTNAYQHVKKLHWPDVYYRHDIGHRAIRGIKKP